MHSDRKPVPPGRRRPRPRHGGVFAPLSLALLAQACGSGGGAAGAPAPVRADFDLLPASGRAPLQVRFHDRSTGPVTSWSWDFGDGTTSQQREPSHVYTAEGAFRVRLTVRSAMESHALERLAVDVAPAPSNAIEFGMNPSFQRWTSREIVFADAMMRASEFVVVRAGELTQEAAALIPLGSVPARLGAGYPDLAALEAGTSAGAWLLGAMEGTLPDGRSQPYVLTWEGSGECSLIGTAVLGESLRRPRRVEVRVDAEIGGGNGTVALCITASSRLDPIRNVHVWLPGTSEQRPLFWAPYLERVQALDHGRGPFVWRTLDWTRVNDYGAMDPPVPFVFDLAGGIRPDSPSQGTRRGMCPEFQVAFCNRVGANLHYQVPHRTDQLASDQYEHYLRDLFTRIRDGAPAVAEINAGLAFEGLRSDLELTLELSNELWNGSFPAHRWFQRQAAMDGITLHQAIARELELVWGIADEVFAGRRTVRRFVGGFLADEGFVRRILEALPAGTRVDALGSACYFRPRQAEIDGWLAGAAGSDCPRCPTPEEVIAAARLSLEELRPLLRAHRALAEAHVNRDGSHPLLELYEAGQSFLPGSAPWSAAAQAAQVHPDMYHALVDGLIPMLVEEGVDVVNWYSFMTDQDPSYGVGIGFGIWNDMAQTITLPVPDVYVDEGAPKAAAIYRGPPTE